MREGPLAELFKATEAAQRTDEPVAIAVDELDRDLFEEGFGAELNRDVGGGEHSGRGVYRLAPAKSRRSAILSPLPEGGDRFRRGLRSSGGHTEDPSPR